VKKGRFYRPFFMAPGFMELESFLICLQEIAAQFPAYKAFNFRRPEMAARSSPARKQTGIFRQCMNAAQKSSPAATRSYTAPLYFNR